jgi:S-adenosylmethionine hydrolase
MSDRFITFLSDFGTREYYTGAVKGAILSVNPSVRIIDLSHDIPSHDLLSGAFTLFGAYRCFPQKTVHLVVVDPGVGSRRRGLIVQTESGLFVAPDNGILSLVYRHEEIKMIVSIEAEHYYRRPVSPTFHGRDIFGPVAGWLSRGIEISNFGSEVRDPVQLGLPATKSVDERTIEGIVIHIDKFGNIITSIRLEEINDRLDRGEKPDNFQLNGQMVSTQVETYSEGGTKEPFFLLGSAGFYEVSAQKQSAARMLNVKRGMKVQLSFAAS